MAPPTSSSSDDRLSGALRATGSYLAHHHNPLLARCFVQLLTRVVPGREFEVADLSGNTHRVDTRDQMGANALVGRYRLPRDVVRFVQPDDWVIDCGANIGIITSQLCAAVGPTGEVWACEPVRGNIERLEQLRSANHLDQLKVMPYAIGSTPGSALIGMPPKGHSGWASMTKSFGIEDRYPVNVETLDRLTETSAPLGKRLRLLKIDVEGYEPEVLAGATALIKRDRPVIYCEFNDVLLRDRGQSSVHLLELFADLGYHSDFSSRERSGSLTGKVVNLVLQA